MANVVDGLAESQLFGHRKGAFSGALADHAGAFDAAHQGTLLLDEIAELPPGLQAKLLRTVETGEVHRIGDSLPHRVDARLVTATHRDLSELSQSGRFRADLYWRIAHSVIEVPALRERKLDVVPLFDHFLGQAGVSRLAALMGEQPASLWSLADLMERLLGYDWPGNVRELREEAFRLADAMRARAGRASGAIPPLEEACSERLLSRAAVAGSEALADTVPDPAEAERYARLLTEPTALGQAIAREAAGNVKVFAERAGASLGRHPGTVRRQIYRLLGEQLEQLRQS
jgi:anaerobic nitric oxide reductase transcription regulator